MNGRPWSGALAIGCLLVATALVPPNLRDVTEFAAWIARPLMLPFAWHSLQEANRGGDPLEAFARAQNLLRLLPQWSDGHSAFAYRFALSDDDRSGTDAERGARARTRLDLAMAWMESARERAGKHELDLLQGLAFLPEVAVRREPALAALLQPTGGAIKITDAWLAEAERLFPTAAVREQRTFFAPKLAAGLLAANDPANALEMLAAAIARSHDVRDQALATRWRQRLVEVSRWLAGDRTIDLTAVTADERFAILLPFLR